MCCAYSGENYATYSHYKSDFTIQSMFIFLISVSVSSSTSLLENKNWSTTAITKVYVCMNFICVSIALCLQMVFSSHHDPYLLEKK